MVLEQYHELLRDLDGQGTEIVAQDDLNRFFFHCVSSHLCLMPSYRSGTQSRQTLSALAVFHSPSPGISL